MAIIISKAMVQQKISEIINTLGPEDADTLLSLADEAYHKIVSLYELLKHAIAYTPRDELELLEILEMLELAMQQIERQFDEAVDQLCPAAANPEPKPHIFTQEGSCLPLTASPDA